MAWPTSPWKTWMILFSFLSDVVLNSFVGQNELSSARFALPALMQPTLAHYASFLIHQSSFQFFTNNRLTSIVSLFIASQCTTRCILAQKTLELRQNVSRVIWYVFVSKIDENILISIYPCAISNLFRHFEKVLLLILLCISKSRTRFEILRGKFEKRIFAEYRQISKTISMHEMS